MVMMRNGRAVIRRVDKTQREIANGLRELGYKVWEIEEPCDLLVYYWSHKHQCFRWQTLECKTPHGKKNPKARVDKRQATQIEFLADTRTPVVLSVSDAIVALGNA